MVILIILVHNIILNFFKSMEELEKEMLNGQKLQGPFTASEVNVMLKNRDMEAE